jgi:cytochrome b involved in lipid metabolism
MIMNSCADEQEMNFGIAVDLANAQEKEKRFRKTIAISGILALFLVAVAMMNGGTTPAVADVVFHRQHRQLKAATDNGGEKKLSSIVKETPTLFVRHLQSKGGVVPQMCDVEHYTAADVEGHAVRENCWFILYDVVYDVTDYVDRHPGGAGRIYDECGTDATQAYASIHSKSVINNDGQSYSIGRLGTESGVQQAPCGGGGGISGSGGGTGGGDTGDDSDSSDDSGDCGGTPTGTCQVMFYTAGDVAAHAARKDCWFILHNVVYDVTNYVDIHPGGASRIYDECGTDATQPYANHHGERVVNCHGTSYILGRLGSSSGVRDAPCLV